MVLCDRQRAQFPCNSLRVRALEANVRLDLADSLKHIVEKTWLAERQGAASNYDRTLSAIKSHRVPPSLFARYYEMVFAIEAGDRLEAARLFEEIEALSPQEPEFRLAPYASRSLGSEFERYAKIFQVEERGFLTQPDPERWIRFERCVGHAFELLHRADAELEEEVRGLICEIIGAGSSDERARPSFGGASSFMLWGTVFLNVDRHQTKLDALEGLVHEAAHQLLFGLSHREPLVLNPLSARYASPLRPDPRPMVGVFHATFVCAKLTYLYRRLRSAGRVLISSQELALVERRIDEQKARFLGGFETISEHADLTENGRALIDEARNYVASDG